MHLFGMMDRLLRNRDELYQAAAEGRSVGGLVVKLLLVFVVTSALYGAVMGSYRWRHSRYVFSDFELMTAEGTVHRGKVAGMNTDPPRVYTRLNDGGGAAGLPELAAGDTASIRFNVTRPTDPYSVASVGEEKGYGVIQLAEGSQVAEPRGWRVVLWVAGKTPLLFILTLLVCCLALYVLNLMLGVGLPFGRTLVPMAFGLATTGTMLGVFTPIAMLFTVVTASYHFMNLMHLLVFAFTGLFGVRVLFEGLMRLAPPGTGRSRAFLLVCSWLVIYALVGAQLAWTLKPFIGTPYLPATPPFRIEAGNIYVSFIRSLGQLF